jgi:hypothetical protein
VQDLVERGLGPFFHLRTNQSTTDAVRLALIEGEQSGLSSLTLDDIIEMEFP